MIIFTIFNELANSYLDFLNIHLPCSALYFCCATQQLLKVKNCNGVNLTLTMCFFKGLFSKESETLLFVSPEIFIEDCQVILKKWRIYPSMWTIYLTYFFFWHCLVIKKLMTSACNRWFQDCSTFSLPYKGFSTIAIGFIVIALVIFGIWRCEGSNWNLSQKKATFKKLVLLRLRKQDILLDKKLMSFLPIWVFLKKSYFHIANNLKKTGLIKGNCMCVSVCVFVCGGRGWGG